MKSLLKIIIVCHKNDYFLSKICVASIRYYYPSVKIFLVKDFLNGQFSTREMEKYFNVKILDLGINKFGWCSAKIHLLISRQLGDDQYLVLDSDVVFIGYVLDKLTKQVNSTDFIVSPENLTDLNSKQFKAHYYNFSWVKSRFPSFRYPGYPFNGGQIVIQTGVIHPSDVSPFFQPDIFPYWTSIANEHLPLRDQSLLNILLPELQRQKRLRLVPIKFMWWSESIEVRQLLDINEIKNAKYPYIIHWAGSPRSRFLRNITRSDILYFFQHLYYNQVPFGNIRFVFANMINMLRFYLNKFGRQLIQEILILLFKGKYG
jgi:hypothetical protein